MKRLISGLILALLLASMFAVAFGVHPVKALETIYITEYGVYPSTAPIKQNGNTYTLTGNIDSDADGIVIWGLRDITLDGAGYTLDGGNNTYVYGYAAGVDLYHSINIRVVSIEIRRFHEGILLNGSSGCGISGNSLVNNIYGIILESSNANNISGNNISSPYSASFSLALWGSSRNRISGNNITCPGGEGVAFQDSHNNVLRNNSLICWNCAMAVEGSSSTDYVQDVDASNTVGGKPVYYWVGEQDRKVPPDASYVGLINCSGITVKNLNLTNNYQGILLVNTTNSIITENNITNNGIGLYLYSSSYNRFYHNNIMNNGWLFYNPFSCYPWKYPAGWEPSMDIWDDSYPSGGNHWSDYAGVDLKRGLSQDQNGSDGIGDTPYVIDSNNTDRYPLMSSWTSDGFNGTVYIRADGSIVPSTAPIRRIGDTYTLTGNIGGNTDGIVIERDNMVLDGAGYTLQGIQEWNEQAFLNSKGVDFSHKNNVTIENMVVDAFGYGIYNIDSNNNSIVENYVTANSYYGITLGGSSSIIANNTVLSTDQGITVDGSNNIVANNIISGDDCGINILGSQNYISNNNASNNGDGIILIQSSGNILRDNTISFSAAYGICLENSSDNTLIDNIASNNHAGICMDQSNNNSLIGNIVLNNGSEANEGIELFDSNNNTLMGTTANLNYDGIFLASSSGNVISGSNITQNRRFGISLVYSSNNNTLYNNNLLNNTSQVNSYLSVNIWDDGYPSGGNCWSDYNGTDAYCGAYQNVTGSDGIGDVPYNIDANNTDRYPLTSQPNISNFTVSLACCGPVNVAFMSNSTVGNVQIDESARSLSFNVSGPTGTSGFCRIVLLNLVVESLWGGNYTVLINGELCPFTSGSDGENTYIYINYTHSEHEIVIVPEYPLSLTILALTAVTILAIKFSKRRKVARRYEDVNSSHGLGVEE